MVGSRSGSNVSWLRLISATFPAVRPRLTAVCWPPLCRALSMRAGNFLQLSGTNHDVHVGSPLENQLLILLRHASHHANDFFGMVLLFRAESSQCTVRFVFSLFADRAGVEQDRIGIADVIGKLVSLAAEAGNHHFTVQHVHLAADRFDVQFVGLGFGVGHKSVNVEISAI